MEKITLPFNLSGKGYGYGEATELRHEISMHLDTALKAAGIGKWLGGSSKFDLLEIFIRVTDPYKAIEIVKSTLTDHWVLPLMEVRRHTL